jgi:hypothetical protein
VIYCYIILIYLLTWKIKLSKSCVWFQCFSKWLSSFRINLIVCWMMCQCVWMCVCVNKYEDIYWVIYCCLILIYLFTLKIKMSESCVWFQCFSKRFSSFWTNLIVCWMMCQCVYEYIKRDTLSDILLYYIDFVTFKIKMNESCVWFQCFSKWFSSFRINLIVCWMMCQCVYEYIKRYILSDMLLFDIDLFTHILYQAESELRLISMLQQVIQLLLIQFDCLLNDVSVCMCEYIKKYIEWYIVILYWFIYLPMRLSWMRVVFDFNASASDLVPSEPIWLSVKWFVSNCVNIERDILSDILLYYIDLFTHFEDQVA